MTPLGPHLTVFLREYIPSQREMSVQTSDTYAYAFQLLVCFAAKRLKTTPSALSVEQLDATLVFGIPRTPRERTWQLRQNAEFEAGCHQDFCPVFGIPLTVVS